MHLLKMAAECVGCNARRSREWKCSCLSEPVLLAAMTLANAGQASRTDFEFDVAAGGL